MCFLANEKKDNAVLKTCVIFFILFAGQGLLLLRQGLQISAQRLVVLEDKAFDKDNYDYYNAY